MANIILVLHMSILKPIIYFSLFKHPLTEEEIYLFSDIKDKEVFSIELYKLLELGIIIKIDDYFIVDKNPNNIKRRIKGNFEAEKIMPKVKKVAKFISKFPFIKGIAVSGSLSKGYYDTNSDFDFFVITKTKRVWFSRMLLAIYKRVFLNNSHKEFCINYFISTETLEIEDKNRFTATEIATIIPLFGLDVFKKFYKTNRWVKKYFPNLVLKDRISETEEIKKSLFVNIIEFIFDNPIGTLINYSIMKVISFIWAKRYLKKDNDPYKVKKEISKHHPDNFQQKVLTKINEQYSFFERKHGINLAREIG